MSDPCDPEPSETKATPEVRMVISVSQILLVFFILKFSSETKIQIYLSTGKGGGLWRRTRTRWKRTTVNIFRYLTDTNTLRSVETIELCAMKIFRELIKINVLTSFTSSSIWESEAGGRKSCRWEEWNCKCSNTLLVTNLIFTLYYVLLCWPADVVNFV